MQSALIPQAPFTYHCSQLQGQERGVKEIRPNGKAEQMNAR